jgi:hypothetical protein
MRCRIPGSTCFGLPTRLLAERTLAGSPRFVRDRRLLTTALRWPGGLLITWWAYVWRITPMYRREVPGSWDVDGPPPLPAGIRVDGIQSPHHGSGAFLRRRYRVDVVDGRLHAVSVIADIRGDINRVVPGGIAQFRKITGNENGPLALGDEFVVRMPGPWDGPVRVVELTPTSFRFATLDGHLEAGQIEWRAQDLEDAVLRFEVESWSRPGDRLSDIAHHRLRMAKEVQLHMWTSVLENVAKLVGGRMRAGVDIHTAVVDV